ncbi:triggering receptor expressed on myeloid cells 2-like [Pleurodeles waltl]|uniref:triggering receptor expressed on myeloid cells 2-like n=1 Tax=Pleurodeles waltl TaxID=8319 RepID=UPI00370939A6
MAPVWLLLILSSISPTAVASADPNSTVSGLVGGSLTIDCPYSSRADLWKQKVWCKEVGTGQCEKIARTRRFYLPFVRRNNGNTSITDYIREHRVSVTIKYLRKEDTGVYRCETHIGDEIHTLRVIKLEVLEELEEMPGAEESRTDSKSHSSLLVMTPGMVTAIFAGILLCKVLVALAVYMTVRRRPAMDRGKSTRKREIGSIYEIPDQSLGWSILLSSPDDSRPCRKLPWMRNHDQYQPRSTC